MRWSRWSVIAGIAAATTLMGACQVLSGLSDLEAGNQGETPSSSGSASAGASAGASVGSTSGGGQGGVGGFGGAGGGVGSVGSTAGSGGAGGVSDGGAGGGGIPAPGCDLPVDQCPVILIDNTFVPVSVVAADNVYIYWGSQPGPMGAGSIWRAKLDGSGVEKLVDGVKPFSMAADGTDHLLFWTDIPLGNSSLRYTSTDASNFNGTLAASGQALGAIAIGTSAAENLFFAEPAASTLNKVISAPGNVPVVFDGALDGAPAELVILGDSVFWHSSGGTRRRDIGGGTNTYSTYLGSFGIAVSNGKIFGTVKSDPGFVWEYDIATDMKTILFNTLFPTYMSANNDYIYWALDSDPVCLNGGGAVRRRSIPMAGAIETLATPLLCPSNIVRSGTSIYWGDAQNRIFRAPSAP
jgi:hypothetical protein